MKFTIPLGLGSVTAEIYMHGQHKDIVERAGEALGNAAVEDFLETVIDEFKSSKHIETTRQSLLNVLRRADAQLQGEDVELVGAREQSLLVQEATEACFRLLR